MSREGSHTALVTRDTDQHDASAQPDLTLGLAPGGTLHLRGGLRDRPHVAWGEDVVDNEGLGRKKSKSTYARFALKENDAKRFGDSVQFVVSTINQGNSTNHHLRNRRNPSRTLRTVLRDQVGSTTTVMDMI